jgi:hypothetical protein
LNPAQKRLVWLGQETEKYFPYLNPKYAVFCLTRAIEEVVLAGEWEMRSRTAGYAARVSELQKIAAILSGAVGSIKFSRLQQALEKLTKFLQSDPEIAPDSEVSPFDAGLIGMDN